MSPCFHLEPINLIVFQGSLLAYAMGNLILRGFMLRCFQHLSLPHIATQLCPWQNNWYTSGASIRSSRTKDRLLSNFLRPRRIGTELSHDVLNPGSRTALMGEQPNPWDRLQPQDAMSRHRGAKPPRRCGLLGR